MAFPETVYILKRTDGNYVVYRDEAAIDIPSDSYVEVGTYILSTSEKIKRMISVTLDRKDTVKTDVGKAIDIVDGGQPKDTVKTDVGKAIDIVDGGQPIATP